MDYIDPMMTLPAVLQQLATVTAERDGMAAKLEEILNGA